MNEANNNPSIVIARNHNKNVIARNPKLGIVRKNSEAICRQLWLVKNKNRLPQHSLPMAIRMMLRNDVLIMLFSFFLISLSSNLFSQTKKPDFNTVDHQTYRFYFLENWDSLIIIGEDALDQNIDYFYLRMRLGTAYYEKENYFKSGMHFEKALQFSNSDPTALEYLYYCYLFTNRELEARLLSKQFSETLNDKIHPARKKVIDEIYLETGPTFSNNIALNKKNNLMGKDSIYGEQDLNENKYYFHFGVKKNIGNRASLYVGYSNLQISKLKQIQTSEVVKSGYDTILSNGWYYVDTTYSKTFDLYDHNYTLHQNELYLNSNITLGNGLLIVPAAHFIHVQYNELHADVKQVEYFRQSYDTVPSDKLEFTYHKTDTSFINYVGWLALYKNISNYRLGLMSSYSNLNGKTQFQLGGEFIWYPHGNLNLYSISRLVMAFENGKKRPVLEEKVGSRVLDNLWIEGYFSLGNMVNYTESNAFVVHNSGDKINFRAGANLILSLSAKTELSFRYQYLSESTYWYRLFNDGIISNTTINYQNHQLIGGIKWKL